MKKFLIIILCLAFTLPFSYKMVAQTKASPNIEAVQALARRIVPAIADRVIFQHIDADTDTFSVTCKDSNIIIQGSTTSALCVGLNHYLRNHLGVCVSWYADEPVFFPESDTASLFCIETSVTGKSDLKNRFFLNYCTFGYTTPFWEWSDWERFIDWMALNGVNMPLAMTGQEKVWLETWRKLGLSDEAILGWFTGPAHLPWLWMSNIDSFQGPLSLRWIERNEVLQKKILERERQLGMTPVLPAFSGHVPPELAFSYPEAAISQRGNWCGFGDDHRTWFLNPADSLYDRIQHTFLTLQDSIFGSDYIYGVDPFNEIESPDWSEDYLRNASSRIHHTLTDADPKAKWLLMTWMFYNDSEHWTGPRIKAFLDGIPSEDLLLLDYYCEVQPVWEITEAYFGKPYLFCYLGNFGGNTMIVGDLRDINQKIDRFISQGGNNKCGIGGTLEGLDVNPVMHEFVLAKAWNPNLTPDEWIDVWSAARGGKESASVTRAWHILNDKIYVDHARNGQGGLTNVRPSLTRRSAGCADATYNYDNSNLLSVLDCLLEADSIENSAYRFDVMNVTRQLLANEFMAERDKLTKAYNNGNIDSVRNVACRMDSMLVDLDRLMGTNDNFSLKRWTERARKHGDNEAEKDFFEKNARTLVTTWGYPGTVLNDYANRHWSGLIDSYYRVRWRRFFDAVIDAMEQGIPFDEDKYRTEIIAWEEDWANTPTSIQPINSDDVVRLAHTIRNRYFVTQ